MCEGGPPSPRCLIFPLTVCDQCTYFMADFARGRKRSKNILTERRPLSTCFGCSRPIRDEYLLRVAEFQWHSQCLRCTECGKNLEEERTCFLQDNGLYCRHDYVRCPGCSLSFDVSDLVVQVRPRTIYHTSCFRCIRCQRPLSSHRHPFRPSPPTDFALLPEGPLCREDFLAAVESRLTRSHPAAESPRSGRQGGKHVDSQTHQRNTRPRHNTWTSDELSDDLCCNNDCKSLTELSDEQFGDTAPDASRTHVASHVHVTSRQGVTSRRGSTPPTDLTVATEGGNQGQKIARVRTVMNETQLGVLRAFYGRNSRPDSTTKDRLAAITGLSTRVIRVWFQNKRCKDKKKTKTRVEDPFHRAL